MSSEEARSRRHPVLWREQGRSLSRGSMRGMAPWALFTRPRRRRRYQRFAISDGRSPRLQPEYFGCRFSTCGIALAARVRHQTAFAWSRTVPGHLNKPSCPDAQSQIVMVLDQAVQLDPPYGEGCRRCHALQRRDRHRANAISVRPSTGSGLTHRASSARQSKHRA